ncbi:unnamed protein product [Vicia faba]|uniref:Uncharacterized protein n=1 Tax=Vicia faba TaxID=3906 RepID=A0AAV1ARI7_VICFA|nr:unnamed protein product [Vicia faba]
MVVKIDNVEYPLVLREDPLGPFSLVTNLEVSKETKSDDTFFEEEWREGEDGFGDGEGNIGGGETHFQESHSRSTLEAKEEGAWCCLLVYKKKQSNKCDKDKLGSYCDERFGRATQRYHKVINQAIIWHKSDAKRRFKLMDI